MKKILFVIYSMGYGGAEKSLVNLLNELPGNTYEVDLLLFQKKGDFLMQLPSWVRVLDTPEDIERLYAPIKKLGHRCGHKILGTVCSRLIKRTKKQQAAFRWKYFYSKKIGKINDHYDVAIAYSGSECLYFIHDKVNADKKLVWIHNDYRTTGYSKEDDCPYLADMDGIVSVSNECVDVLKAEFPQYQQRMHYIENITSSIVIKKRAELFTPAEYTQGKNNLLSIGRLHPQKGFDLAIEAASILKKNGIDFCWYIIGEGPLKEKLVQQIQKFGVEEYVVLLGTRNNPYPYIKHCAFVVQPSRYEGKSVVLDEAKILGKPIVATNYPTVWDQIEKDKEGIITDMNPESIANGIQRMITETELRRSMELYLGSNEYGNSEEINKYRKIIDG